MKKRRTGRRYFAALAAAIILQSMAVFCVWGANQTAPDRQDTETEGKEEQIPQTGLWHQEEKGRWYEMPDGTRPASCWRFIDNVWYAFDEDGWARTGWFQEGSRWYYLNQDGGMATGWLLNGGQWYYLRENGAMATGWLQEGSTWYYLRGNGAMATGWQWIGRSWYYLRGNGSMATDWLKEGSTWYYLKDSGAMATGWQLIGNTWYYLKGNGAMATGWLQERNTWYYLKGNGAMATGWLQKGSTWYYLKDSGAMATGWQLDGSTWYYLKGSGAMATGWQLIGNTWYYLKGNGAMAVGWQLIGSTWYYLKDNGAMATGWIQLGNTWYYLKSSGKMAADEWIGNYFVDKSGAWIPDKARGKLIAIDAGHQLKGNSEKEPIGPGASATKAKVTGGAKGTATGLYEYELNLQVSLKLRDELKARGYEVYMIRETNNVNISNAERAKMAARAGADILVRIHANSDSSSSATGALTIAPSKNNPYIRGLVNDSRRLSQNILDSFCAATGAKNRGILTSDEMSGINWSTVPVTIVEMGFMSNASEDRRMADAGYQKKMAKGIADGIDNYFN